ncbi:hypothetical protein CRUP_016651 [Coryphaenoides rupestris]|nr:hypothetical protein CRUP_016651 [Coryphaenoides rupestris]
MAFSELYSKCARVWLPDPVTVWRSAELTRAYSPGDGALSLQLEDGSVLEHNIDPKTNTLLPLRNPDLLVGENDLTALSYLHEPAVLHNLKVRFTDSKLIYTYCGKEPFTRLTHYQGAAVDFGALMFTQYAQYDTFKQSIVLVAINPYDSLSIYEADVIYAYSGQDMGDMDPHIFAVAEEAYKNMARDERNQSIIVSGESGAGKTVSAKYVMRYIATVSRSLAQANVEEKVLASNPIMEAIGNAKTTRNDNSSRFGKYIEIGFDKKNRIIGAMMKTYLLEKSRVVFQPHGERNYHILYQLCASAHLPEFKAFKLGCADDYLCTNQGQSLVIEGVDDAEEMCETRRALTLLGFSESDQMALFQILAAILHFSNVEVKRQSADSSSVTPDQDHLVVFCELMGISYEDMAYWLCHRKLKTATETYAKTLPKASAVNGRDALAKHIYAKLFGWIVDCVNRTLKFSATRRCFIGVLDIYGFETFDVNSFEQFCINYANEKLQQQFNLHVFKLEQEEYMKEEISWSLIDFYDNEPCIKLIEAKMGVLDLLDEECKMPKGSDDTWVQKLYAALLKQNVHFDKPRLSNRAFIIHHFADKAFVYQVEYQCDGFLEKNKDTVNEEQINVLKTSKFDLLVMLLEEHENNTDTASSSSKMSRRAQASKVHKKTVGLQSLTMLMDTLNATTPHYVRCIKPNDLKAPFTLEPMRTVQQLRSCGVLETIRISAAGFPSRWTYLEFFNRYRVLVKRKDVQPDCIQTCKTTLEKLIKDKDKYQFGKSKIFFRAGQVAYLESLRSDTLRRACVRVQKTLRCWLARKKFLRMRRFVKLLRWTNAAVVLQKSVRMWAGRRAYQRQRSAAITIQRCFRAYKARQAYYKLLYEEKAVVLQRWARGWLARRHYRRALAGVVLLQSCVRRLGARRELKRLRVEARSVEHYKKLHGGMENKIIQLQRRLDQQQKEHREVSVKLSAVEKIRAAESERLGGVEQDAQAKAQRLSSLSEQLASLHLELDAVGREKEKQARAHREHTEKMASDLIAKMNTWNSERDELKGLIQDQAEQTSAKAGHRRTDSNQSSVSSEGTHSSGYADGRDSPTHTEDVTRPAVDMPVLLKLQRKVKNLEEEKRSLIGQLDRREEAEQEKSKRQELESENRRLKQDLGALRKSLSDDSGPLAPPKPGSKPYSVLLEQLDSSYEELEMRKEEVLLLRSHMVRQEVLKHKDSLTDSSLKLSLTQISLLQDTDSSTTLHTLNEDGELWLAYEGLKETNRVLESQLQEQGRAHQQESEEVRRELQRVKQESQQQQQLLAKSLQLPKEAQIEACLQHEITRMANENLDLMERQESQDKTIHMLKKQLRSYTERLEEFEACARKQSTASQIGIPVNITRKEKEFQGMLEYKEGDESMLLKNLVVDLKPRGVAVSFLPGLPAYIIFMCVRYADHLNDEERVSTLLNSTIITIKGVIKRRGHDFDTVSFWLANTCRFLHCLRQYSGDEDFTKHNTPRQNEHCLANFELSGYQQVFGDLVIQIYQQLGVLGSMPTGQRKRGASAADEEAAITLETILQRLGQFHGAMGQHGMDPELVRQALRQLFHFICAVTLNHLLLRKDMCSWGKGLQLRYKVWQLEEWLVEKELAECGAKESLDPLIQAAQLLQINKKTPADAQAIVAMCTALTAPQNLLKDRGEATTLMADVKTVLPISIPFAPSLVVMDAIQIPASLHLGFLTRYNRVWVPDAEHVWKSAEIIRDFHPGDDVLDLRLEDGTEYQHKVDTENPQLPHLRNPDILVGENDLTALSYLHEPAVLHNLRVRFVESKIIYTYCGIILVAVNPYKQLHVYGDAVIHAYSGQNMGDMDPHIFAVAEEAYKQMARNHKNQSIIVSGESGAGKTVSARYAMRYFAVVSKSGSKTRIEDKAIGNAKTTRNDNSSRFGKYTEISFDKKYRIIGANMRTYLLEKSRVVFQAENERNYHIFYQMCACADLPEFKTLRLSSADKFQYTSMGGEIRIEGVDDRKDLEETQRTFSLLGLGDEFQFDVFRVLAAILHLGNVEIKTIGGDQSSVAPSDPHLVVFCDLLHVSAQELCRWLCSRRIVLVMETVVKPVTQERAVSGRDALAKQIYAHLFDCVIHKINKALKVPGIQHAFIGVLDIYGFETFDTNSFEQFCINYANEKLQQQFNLHVFKLEQEEYMKEDIPWTLIDFYDNQPVIDLIEAKMGILDLLDEECLFPQGTDQNWLQKLYNYLHDNPLFEKPRLSNEAFMIQHFADKVEYHSKGFLEKNRDALYEDLVEIMRASKFALLADFFQEEAQNNGAAKGFKVRPARPGLKPANKELRTTVGDKFRSSLYLLMETLNATTPHYVRCIKPNDEKLPFEYDSRRVVQQLRACGVLETIHISAQSYPSRWTYIEFYSRYSILTTPQELAIKDKKQACKTVMQRIIQVAYLEKLRLDRLRGACVTIQKRVRGWSQRRKYLRMREAAIVLQQYVRGERQIRHWRGYRVRQIYQMVYLSTVTIQAFTRGWIARKQYKKMVEERQALVLQKYARAWLARRRYQTIRRLVLNVQLSYRCQQLRKKIDDQNKENRGLVERLTSLASTHSHTMDRVHSLEAQLQKSAGEKVSWASKEKKAKEYSSQEIIQLRKEKEALLLEKQTTEEKFEASSKAAQDNFDQVKKALQEEKEREERLKKIAENNMEILREDHEKEVAALKEEIRRLKEERLGLQQQVGQAGQANEDLQEQVVQLTKHLK